MSTRPVLLHSHAVIQHRRFTDDMLDGVAARFKALAEPMRLRVLDALRAGERTVGDLVDDLEASQANISKHLGVLFREGLVTRRKDGLHVWYRVADPSVFRLCDVVCGTLEARAARQVRSFQAPPAGRASRR